MTSAREAAAKQTSGSDFSVVRIPEGMKFFKLEKGNMIIDVLPYLVGAGNPFAEEGTYHYERTYYMHRKIGPSGGAHVCLARTVNKPCPACEYTESIRAETDEKTLKEMLPKRRQLMLVVNRKDKESGVQLLESSYFSFGKLLAERINSEPAVENGWDKFSDPKEGLRLSLTISEETMGKNKYLKVTAIDFLPRKEQYGWKYIDEHTVCLDDILKIEKYSVFKAAMEGADADEETPPPARKPTKPDPEDETAPAGDEEAPPPKKKPAPAANDTWDEETPAPVKKRPPAALADDAGEEETPAPKKKPAPAASSDWDEEAPPLKKKAPPADPEDEEAPPPKKKAPPAALADDDEAPPAKKKAASTGGSDWDD